MASRRWKGDAGAGEAAPACVVAHAGTAEGVPKAQGPRPKGRSGPHQAAQAPYSAAGPAGPGIARGAYSTVTDFARFRGLSMSRPSASAVW